MYLVHSSTNRWVRTSFDLKNIKLHPKRVSCIDFPTSRKVDTIETVHSSFFPLAFTLAPSCFNCHWGPPSSTCSSPEVSPVVPSGSESVGKVGQLFCIIIECQRGPPLLQPRALYLSLSPEASRGRASLFPSDSET